MPDAFPFVWTGRPYLETRAFTTGIHTAHSGQEYRQAKRMRAQRLHEFEVEVMQGRAAGLLQSLLYRGHELEFGVPFWPHATRLTADAILGATVLNVPTTTDLDFYAGQHALLWADPFTAELVTIDAGGVGATTLTLSTGTTRAWLLGAVICPAHRGRLVPTVETGQRVRAGAQARVAFELDPLGLPVAPTDPAQAVPPLFSVGLWPDRNQGSMGDTLVRKLARFAPPTGGFTDTLFQDTPGFQWTDRRRLKGRAMARALWTWYESVLGRLVPSWVPSYRAGVEPVGAIATTDTAITIQQVGFEAAYEDHEENRHLALITPSGAIAHHRILTVVDNGDGTETLNLEAATGVTMPLGSGRVCLLRYARLAEDAVTVAWDGPTYAQVELPFRTLPVELGASGEAEWIVRRHWADSNNQWWIYDPGPFQPFDFTEAWNGLEMASNPSVPLGGAAGYFYLEREYGPYTPGHTVTFQCKVRVFQGNPAGSVNLYGIKVNQDSDNELGVDPGALLTAEQSENHTEVPMSTSVIVPAGGTVWVGLGSFNFEYAAPGGLILFYDPVVSVAP